MAIPDLFNSNFEYDPIIHNLTQNLRFHDSHHVGVYRGKTSPVGDENPRVRIEMSPTDSKSKEESNRTSRYSVRKDRIVKFAPGELGPRAHWWLMPDNADQLPSRVRNHKQLGPFFDGYFKHQNVMKALRFKAKTEAEVMDKLRFATTPSELDDRVARAFNNYLSQVEDHAEAMNSNNGSDGGS